MNLLTPTTSLRSAARAAVSASVLAVLVGCGDPSSQWANLADPELSLVIGIDPGDLALMNGDPENALFVADISPVTPASKNHCLHIPFTAKFNGRPADVVETGSSTYVQPKPGTIHPTKPYWDCSQPVAGVHWSLAKKPPQQADGIVRWELSDGTATIEVEADLGPNALHRRTPLPLRDSRFIEFEWIGSAPFDASTVSIIGDVSADGGVPYPYTIAGNHLVIDTGPPSKDQYDVQQLTVHVALPPASPPTKCTAPAGCVLTFGSSEINSWSDQARAYELTVWGRGKP